MSVRFSVWTGLLLFITAGGGLTGRRDCRLRELHELRAVAIQHGEDRGPDERARQSWRELPAQVPRGGGGSRQGRDLRRGTQDSWACLERG